MKKILICLIVMMQICTSTTAFYENLLEDDETIEIASIIDKKELKLNAKNAILFDRKYKRVLYSKNADEKVANASTTKILTAIVAFENCEMQEIVTISQKAASTGGSRVKFRTGDKITMNDLMQGLLLCSGNDAAVAIAEHVGGDVESFCQMLNDKAEEIGAHNTHFVSPHGLDNEEHYSTAYDLALISDYALNIPYIANIVKKTSAVIRVNDSTRTISTTNEMLSTYLGADGVKTGFTGNAGRCLVTSATNHDWQLISVVLGCDTKKQRTMDSINLLDYGFNNFKEFDICSVINKKFDVFVEKSEEKEYLIKFEEKCILPLLESEISNLNVTYDINYKRIAPLKSGEIIGKVTVYSNNCELNSFNITLKENIRRLEIGDYIKEIIFNIGNYLKI